MLAFTAQTTYASHMAERRGFTIVELVIVMVIMAILLTLTISGVTSGQVSARDSEAQGRRRKYRPGP
ncbi:type II secretion system protein [Candidatus Saccharibacteria bacterium]|nr:MAG: type II secretion system protein [Candidatus Saccharibacteria bacterium]